MLMKNVTEIKKCDFIIKNKTVNIYRD